MAETELAKTLLDELTYRIIGCGMAVHRKLGPGYREEPYQRDLQAYLAEKDTASPQPSRSPRQPPVAVCPRSVKTREGMLVYNPLNPLPKSADSSISGWQPPKS